MAQVYDNAWFSDVLAFLFMLQLKFPFPMLYQT
jgi:hypothetical protein